MKTLTNARMYLALLFCVITQVDAQTINTRDTVDLLGLSFEDLLNVRIISASKKEESLFDAPLSASVLSRKEIERAGCTSIMDAFRIIPGLLVREQSNGNFDIHLRGMNDINLTGTIATATNTTTLVMIDGRPVYSYLHGGTFWETLPIDINDVDRIEVVRGPSSAIYGPNAVSGVINIITLRTEKNGLQAFANAQAGSFNTYIANTSLQYRFDKKLDISVSGNVQDRDRTQMPYYETYRNMWIDDAESLINGRSGFVESNLKEKYAQPRLALKKYGLNAFVNYAPSKNLSFNVAAGLQDSKVQKAYFESHSTVLATSASDSRYADIKVNAGALSSQFSYLQGTYETQVGGPGQLYDFKNVDAVIEYNVVFKKLSLKPGVNFRRSQTDDTRYTDAQKQDQTFNGSNFAGRNEIITKAAFLRAEYQLLDDKIRLVAGARVDRFNQPDELYPSYQFALNYHPSNKTLFRFVVGRANQSPFINNNYIDLMVLRLPLRSNGQVIPGKFSETRIAGNTQLKMLTSDMFEIGYRSKLTNNFLLDVEIFTSNSKNYAIPISGKLYEEIKGPADTVTVNRIVYQNTPLTARQFGATVSVNYGIGKIQINPFVTVQATTLYDFSDFNNTTDAPPTALNPDPAVNNMSSGMGSERAHEGTPAIYGGAYINYQINPKVNINVNPYFYSENTFYTRTYAEFRDGQRGIDHLPSKLMINTKISYTPVQIVTVFATLKNLLNDNSREFYRTDKMGRMIYFGASFQLK